jgi:hypothetical protein
MRAKIDFIFPTNRSQFIDILKIDIEGGEFDSLASFLNSHADGELPIGQLQLEIHAWAVASALTTLSNGEKLSRRRACGLSGRSQSWCTLTFIPVQNLGLQRTVSLPVLPFLIRSVLRSQHAQWLESLD